MELNVIIQSIGMISIFILIGVIISNRFEITESTRTLFTMIIVNVSMPCIILSSVFSIDLTEDTFQNIGAVFALSLIINIIGIIIGYILAAPFASHQRHRIEIALLSGLGNTGFIGIPLCSTLFGPEGALYAAIFDAGVDIIIWTIGIMILSNSYTFNLQTIKNIINIPILAIIIGLVCAFFQFRPPYFIIDTINHLASLASPLAMFYIGFLISATTRKTVFEHRFRMITPIISKLLIVPCFAILIMLIFKLDIQELAIQVFLVQATMPTLTLSSILFTKYGKDGVFGAISTIASTILSIISIPIIIIIISRFL